MPSLEKHIMSSMVRTGKSYKELHEWLDGRNLSAKERLSRHNIFKLKHNLVIVRHEFGEDGVNEYLNHLKEDYVRNMASKMDLRAAQSKVRGFLVCHKGGRGKMHRLRCLRICT